jgi:hypothetical protein
LRWELYYFPRNEVEFLKNEVKNKFYSQNSHALKD